MDGQAIMSDTSAGLAYNCNLPHIAPAAKSSLETIFNRKFLVTAVDEFHNARNQGRTHWGSWALRKGSQCFIGMTATPVLTRPQVRYDSFHT